MIYGNIDGVKKSAIEELERLYKTKCPKDSYLVYTKCIKLIL